MRNLSNEELRALLTTAKAKRQRDWLMILVTYSHALRASETLSLQRDDIQDGFLSVRRLKGSDRTVQPLIESDDPLFSERDPLIDYISAINPGQLIFKITRQRFWQIIQEHGKAAGIPEHKLFVHALKHTIGQELVKNVPINMVQKYMGHKSLSSTGMYLKVTDDEAAKAVQGAMKAHRID